MPSSTITDGNTRLVHFLDLNEYGLEDVPADKRGDVKAEVADYLKNEVLRFLARGTSPVKGEGRFRILKPNYARKFKGGVRTANLELEGDLKDSIIAEPSDGAFIKFGHEGAQVPKADGHNQISSKAQRWAVASRHPKRRYIPNSSQKFVDEITEEVINIVNEFKVIDTNDRSIYLDNASKLKGAKSLGTETILTNAPIDELNVNFIGIDDLFGDQAIEVLLLDALNRRGN